MAYSVSASVAAVSESSNMSVFDRLYGKYKYGPPLLPPPPPYDDLPPSANVGIAAAGSNSSFINNTSFAHSKPLVVSSKPIEGFEKSVNRMRTVNELKQRQKEMEENEWKVEDEKYKKSR